MLAPNIARRLPLLTLAACGALAAIGGCKSEVMPGELVVNYVLGNSKLCSEIGVERLEVKVYQGSIDEPDIEFSENKLCNDDGEIVVTDIEPGIYSVAVFGIDDNSVEIFDNQGQPSSERSIEIFEDAQATIDAELTARPAQLMIAWRLGAGGFANCDGVGIDRFEIKAYEEGGGTLLLETTMDCELAGDDMGFRVVADPERLLNGARFGEVGFQPLDASGAPIGDQAAFVFTPVGPGYEVQLHIECTDTSCYEQP